MPIYAIAMSMGESCTAIRVCLIWEAVQPVPSDEEIPTVLDVHKRRLEGGGRKKPSGAWTPTLFENEPLNLDICLINSRPYHPQANRKIKRFYGILEDEICHHKNPDYYIEYCNADRLHFSLGIDNYETPMMIVMIVMIVMMMMMASCNKPRTRQNYIMPN